MTAGSVPAIFWITLAAVPALTFVATVIGRAWTGLLPPRLRGPARFYLAPALGLATLTVVATMLGRNLALGNRALLPLLLAGLAAWALARRRFLGLVLRQSLCGGGFALVCGVGILAPLLLYGGFNTDNDTFTYLAHAQWLQQHPFSEPVVADTMAPYATQILLYQKAGYRMGGSYLLALLQSLFHLRWAYAAYPTLLIAAIASCCLSLGFPLARQLRSMPRAQRLLLLALPAFALGGLTFGANFGFMPQTLGMALAAAALFMAGPLLDWVARSRGPAKAVAAAALPGGVLLAGATLAYSELSPFVGLALAVSAVLLALRRKAWRNLLLHAAVVLAVAALLLNVELLRAWAALRAQLGVVVGSPVDWRPVGFLAHAFGVHGGAWDDFQWAATGAPRREFVRGLLLLAAMLAPIAFNLRALRRAALLPTLAILGIFGVATLYFRYAVPSPFPIGTGQSWSQAKLADWAFPFAIALTLFSLARLRRYRRFRPHAGAALVLLFAVGVACTINMSVARVAQFVQPYGGIRNMERFYVDLRQAVLATCPPQAPVHLELDGYFSKFRQMAALYLHDRVLTADWRDDVYFDWMPVGRRNQKAAAGGCVIQSAALAGQATQLPAARTVGSIQVALAQPGALRIGAVSGAYQRETDGANTWYWVRASARFSIEPGTAPASSSASRSKTRLRFEYLTRGPQALTLRVVRRDGSAQQLVLHGDGKTMAHFDQVIDAAPAALAELNFSTDGKATVLGPGDPRLGAWLIRNIALTAVTPHPVQPTP
jgi:hypothetical protein